MVNYCCVPGCLRNSGKNPNLIFFGLPKDPKRQEKWLKAVGREDLLSPEMEKTKLIKRFCSRHFTTLQMTKRHMQSDAVPTLHLHGEEASNEPEVKQEVHPGIACNMCGQQLFGFRYMCLSCPDFDLCQKCEANEAHPDHIVVRLPKPVHYTKARKIARKCQRVFGTDPIAITNQSSDKSDDQSDDQSDDSEDMPITKYRTFECDLTISERIAIQNEIERALKVPKPEEKPLRPIRRRRDGKIGILNTNTFKTVSHVSIQTDDVSDDAIIDFELSMKEERNVPVLNVRRGEESQEVEEVVAKREEQTPSTSDSYVAPRPAQAPNLDPSELDSAAIAELSEFIIIPQRY